MHFVCDQETLATWLKRAALFADSKSPIEILDCVKIDVIPGKLVLTTSNSSFQFYAEIPLTDMLPVQPGSICINADRIASLVATLRPDCPVELSSDTQLKLASGRTRATLNTLPADHFPVFDSVFRREPQVITTTAELDRVLAKALPPMGDNADRMILWGMSLQYDGTNDGLSAAACDGTFGAICTLHANRVAEFPAAIVPRPVCQKLRTLLKGSTGELAISISPSNARIATNQWSIVTKLIDGVYPTHNQIAAPPVESPVTIESDEFYAILARITAGTDLDSKKLKQRGAVISFDNNVMTVRDGHDTVNDKMDVIYDDTVAPAEVGFNTAHMMEAIDAIDATEIELHFTDRDSRIRVCAAGDTEEHFITMPYRVN